MKLTREHRARISASMMGHPVSQKVRDMLRDRQLGVPLPELTKRKIRATCRARKINFGESNGNWKGNQASPIAARIRAHRVIRKTGPCELCGAQKTERHHKDGNPFNNARSNLMVLCRKCHMEMDGRLEEFRKMLIEWHKRERGRLEKMSTRGSALQRTVNYFSKCTIDEARVTFKLVEEIVHERLKREKGARQSQDKAARAPRKPRKSKQTTIEEGARAAGAAGSISV